ncbi:hypothetical protein TNCV_1149841 [Trichonephila clavipes]|nr:hypothetical protein TNCV_1149841 [Trichonephila clavipes]
MGSLAFVSPDHPVNRYKTKGEQSGPEEEDTRSTDPALKIQNTSSSPQARVIRRQREDGNAIRIQETEEPNSNNAKKWEENPLTEGRRRWRF